MTVGWTVSHLAMGGLSRASGARRDGTQLHREMNGIDYRPTQIHTSSAARYRRTRLVMLNPRRTRREDIPPRPGSRTPKFLTIQSSPFGSRIA
jgi:hypothetical protein